MFCKAEEPGSEYLVCFWLLHFILPLLHFILPLSTLPTQQLHYSRRALTAIGTRFIAHVLFPGRLPPGPARWPDQHAALAPTTHAPWTVSVTHLGALQGFCETVALKTQTQTQTIAPPLKPSSCIKPLKSWPQWNKYFGTVTAAGMGFHSLLFHYY